MKRAIISIFLFMAIVQCMVMPSHAITCNEVTQLLMPCILYLTIGVSPSETCCDGVKQIKDDAPTTADRRAVCHCIMDNARQFLVNEEAAAALPAKCGVPTTVAISSNMTCEEVN